MVDHADGDGLNSQRKNLRTCTNAENKRIQRKYKNCSSPCKGVHWSKAVNKWRVVLTINNKRMELGLFIDEVEAVKAYDMAALKYHKEFAKLNFPLAAWSHSKYQPIYAFPLRD